jgi:hypothetical protein
MTGNYIRRAGRAAASGAGVLFVIAGVAAAQSLPARDAVQWLSLGTVGGASYFIDETSVTREGDTVRVLMRASSPPSPSDNVNTIVARVFLDCRAQLVGLEARDYYRELGGFAQSAGPSAGGLQAPSDPGQTLLLERLCTPQS